MKKLAHILILGVFGIACWFLWVILHFASAVGDVESLPAYTTFCVGLRPVMLVLPMLAAAYCLWILFRKTERLPSWVTFFAVTMSVMVLVTLPTLLAAYLPLVKTINYLAIR